MPMIPNPTGPKPWPMERRNRMKARIDKAAAVAKHKLGAHTVVIIATFEDGEFLHMQEASDGEDVALQ